MFRTLHSFCGPSRGKRDVRTRRRTGTRQDARGRRIGNRGFEGTFDCGSGQRRPGRNDHRNDQRCAGGGFESGRDRNRHSKPSRAKQNRHQLRVDAGHRLPGHVHAGRVCHGGIRAMPGEERESHVHDELLRVHGGVVLLLDCGVCHTNGRRGRKRKPGRAAVTKF